MDFRNIIDFMVEKIIDSKPTIGTSEKWEQNTETDVQVLR